MGKLLSKDSLNNPGLDTFGKSLFDLAHKGLYRKILFFCLSDYVYEIDHISSFEVVFVAKGQHLVKSIFRYTGISGSLNGNGDIRFILGRNRGENKEGSQE